MDWAIGTLGWIDIIHIIHPDNAASIRLARKLGATDRGLCRLPPPLDASGAHVWGQPAAAYFDGKRKSGFPKP